MCNLCKVSSKYSNATDPLTGKRFRDNAMLRTELDIELKKKSDDYFNSLNDRLKLDVRFSAHCGGYVEFLPGTIMGRYNPTSKQWGINDKSFGEILIDISKHDDEVELFDTIRHEICHAICDLRYKNNCGHGELWIRIAKLFRVNVQQYLKTV